MPKRKRSKEEDKQHLHNKIKKLERRLQQLESDTSSSTLSDLEEVIPLDIGTDTPCLQPTDWILEVPIEDTVVLEPDPSTSELSSQPENIDETPSKEDSCVLDNDALEILGEDPSTVVKQGPEVRDELAKRLVHIATEGLTRDLRKELIFRYITPANCIQLNAPTINAEIKAAINEASLKRDKGILAKQKQLSSAISGLCQLINTQIVSKDKDKESLQKLMDVAKILCDLQHADSVTRRNFILFSLKSEMKDHIKNTKINTFLFGDQLAETLKTAKAVNKSGAELKNAETSKNPSKTQTKPLNRRAPPQPRRPHGQAPTQQFAPRSWQPAPPRPPLPPPAPPASSSRVSSQQNRVSAPPPQQRRRY